MRKALIKHFWWLLTTSIRWIFTQCKRRKSGKNLIFYPTKELYAYLCPYVLMSICLRSLKIFYFSSKISCKKSLAVKSHIFILSMSMPDVKQLEAWKKNSYTRYAIFRSLLIYSIWFIKHEVQIASDQGYQYDFKKIPGCLLKKC